MYVALSNKLELSENKPSLISNFLTPFKLLNSISVKSKSGFWINELFIYVLLNNPDLIFDLKNLDLCKYPHLLFASFV